MHPSDLARAPLRHDFADRLPELAVPWQAEPGAAPALVVANEGLAVELGIDPASLRRPEGIGVVAGGVVPPGATPVAQAYAGHQFGGYSPRLGDGRALLLGELTTPDGRTVDLHLKGSGRTPFARGGDGRAVLGPMLREHLISEAMHALGIPTTRSLAVCTTGDQVWREGAQSGAVLARVAASHLRVGTFQYAASLQDPDVVVRLTDLAIERHHPSAAEAPNRFLALFEAVADAQARLVARWMHVGFVHGVMNTDNTTISGETIDYGPCAFVDAFDPATVFSSIDHGGRYAFGNQPHIVRWNLARLAEALLPHIDPDQDAAVAAAMVVIDGFPDRFTAAWRAGMAAKLGLEDPRGGDDVLIDAWLGLLQEQHADHTAAHRALADAVRGDDRVLRSWLDDPAALDRWLTPYRERLAHDPRPPAAIADAMDAVNPVVIPRNHLVEEALAAATAGDLAPFEHLLAEVTRPFAPRAADDRYALPAPPGFADGYQTFCGT